MNQVDLNKCWEPRQLRNMDSLRKLKSVLSNHLGLASVLGNMNTNEPLYDELDKLHESTLKVEFMLVTFNECNVCLQHKNHSYEEHIEIISKNRNLALAKNCKDENK